LFIYKKANEFLIFSKKLLYNRSRKSIASILSIQKSYCKLYEKLFFLFRERFVSINSSILKGLISNLNRYRSISLHIPYETINFKNANKLLKKNNKVLSLNFTRNRFFPVIRTLHGESYVTLSLGMFSKFFKKGKFFIKNKLVFLLVASFIRKILLFSSIKKLILFIKKTPLFFKEILSRINDSAPDIYDHPFTKEKVNEKLLKNPFRFTMLIFINNKAYGFLKKKKKGRIKRKIAKRLILLNRVLD